MGWVSVAVEAIVALLKGLFGMSTVRKEEAKEADEDADIGSALGDPDKLRSYGGSGGGKGDGLGTDGDKRQGRQ